MKKVVFKEIVYLHLLKRFFYTLIGIFLTFRLSEIKVISRDFLNVYSIRLS